ncbi:NCS1 family nucleobase:cation symporter-1 [Brevibacillus dissolubilis]|uniref:NCS1 family nucleobase:cation symporter-1 n=1 Tax=Brevibacillus dissolubilis TaxID=1844116 RepID=UPI00111624AF|nr:NCS1 family nucleobase:cation symporter-1 [Brevibacillus dissolubilis]
MKTQQEMNSIVTLTADGVREVEGSPLWNDDLRPTTIEEHNWRGYHFAALWIGMCICIPTYMLASGLIALGMNWWQAIGTIFLGNLIVMVPILLNAHAGTKFGIPYPVFARLWFGSRGAHIPALARAIVAAGWFGINAWFGGTALDALIHSFWSGWQAVPMHTGIVFILFWGLNMYIAYRGPQAIKKLGAFSAPILAVLAVALLIWAGVKAGGFGPMLSAPSKFNTTGEFMQVFWPALTGIIAFWATLALNIPDFCRYAVSQKSQARAQILSMPLTMALFSFIGVAVTSATVVIFGEPIWDPVVLLTKFPPIVVLIGAIGIVLASVTINIGANIVAPARAISNLWPRRITFGMGAVITGLVAITMQPWYILENFGNYIFGWLGTYGALLGPIDGIAIADYWLVRKCRMHLTELYKTDGHYSYRGGFNWSGVYALIIGLAASLIGLVIPGLGFLWENAWTVGLVVSMLVYWWMMRGDQSLLGEEEYARITAQN